MYYNCGDLDNYRYVYDSDDGSCELVEKYRLMQSNLGVEKRPIRSSLSLAKLRMLYGFDNSSDIAMRIKFCTYTVDFEYFEDFKICLSFIVLDLSRDEIGYNRTGRVKHELNDFCYDNYMIFMIVTPVWRKMMSRFRTSPSFKSASIKGYRIMGFPVPLQMLDYVFKFVRNRDIFGIIRAFGGTLYDNLEIKILGDTYDWQSKKYRLDEKVVKWLV